MQNIFKSCSAVLISLTLITSCGEKKSDNPAETLAGNTSKTWHIGKQTDSNGDKEKLSAKEKEETINLYRDGKFSIVDEKGTATGKWSVEGTDKFVMQFENQSVTENFSILNLSKDKVTLKAGDGSEMVLKAD